MLFDKYTLDEVLNLDLPLVKTFKQSEIKILYRSFKNNLNAPLSSSVGRLFDAMASFSNLLHFQSYEGEAGLICEKNYKYDNSIFDYFINDNTIEIEYDFFDKNLVSTFINTIVKIIVDISLKEAIDVILSGGVFQNKTLLELTIKELEKQNIKYYYQKQTSINDGGISLGQIYYGVIFSKNKFSVS